MVYRKIRKRKYRVGTPKEQIKPEPLFSIGDLIISNTRATIGLINDVLYLEDKKIYEYKIDFIGSTPFMNKVSSGKFIEVLIQANICSGKWNIQKVKKNEDTGVLPS